MVFHITHAISVYIVTDILVDGKLLYLLMSAHLQLFLSPPQIRIRNEVVTRGGATSGGDASGSRRRQATSLPAAVLLAASACRGERVRAWPGLLTAVTAVLVLSACA